MKFYWTSLTILSALFLAGGAAFAQDITRLGGDTTTDFKGRFAIQLPAPNISSEERRLLMLSGFSVFHRTADRNVGLGPFYINSSCGGCHVENGRGPIRFSQRSNGDSTMVVKVSLARLNSDGSPRSIPEVGQQVQNHAVSGKPPVQVSLKWLLTTGRYPDGTKYTLRRPKLELVVKGKPARRIRRSLRMSPAIIGTGLLEALPQSVIEAMSDPLDLDGDGISGRPNYVPDRQTNQLGLGRFGFKATHPTLLQQSSAAFFGDIGITSSLFPLPDKAPEVSDLEMTELLVYQKLAGVPLATNQDDPKVIAGKALFQTVGCDSCHRITLTTGATEDPELSNQEIHPFTDLLLHDMGRRLSDNQPEFSAGGSEWRTTPLWGLGFSSTISRVKPLFLHDGRARTIEEAILWHGGESEKSRDRFKALSKTDRDSLIAFLRSL